MSARKLLQRALAIQEKATKPDHANMALYLNNLAEVSRLQGNLSEALKLGRRVVDMYEKALGPNHPTFAASLGNLSVILLAKGKN